MKIRRRETPATFSQIYLKKSRKLVRNKPQPHITENKQEDNKEINLSQI
jgi:hypothetical protein